MANLNNKQKSAIKIIKETCMSYHSCRDGCPFHDEETDNCVIDMSPCDWEIPEQEEQLWHLESLAKAM